MATLKIKDSNGNWQEVFALKGNTGPKGEDGKTPDITLEVTTLPAGSTATVTKSGTSENPIFRLGIPKGDKGDTPTGVVKLVNNESPDINGNVNIDVTLTKDKVTSALGYTPLQTAPVTSVDGKTGAVSLSNVYQLKGNYLTSAPVTSVNGMTGAVNISSVSKATAVSGVQASVAGSGKHTAPSGGTWWCFGTYALENNNDDGAGSYLVNKSVPGGGSIFTWNTSNFRTSYVQVVCIRIA